MRSVLQKAPTEESRDAIWIGTALRLLPNFQHPHKMTVYVYGLCVCIYAESLCLCVGMRFSVCYVDHAQSDYVYMGTCIICVCECGHDSCVVTRTITRKKLVGNIL